MAHGRFRLATCRRWSTCKPTRLAQHDRPGWRGRRLLPVACGPRAHVDSEGLEHKREVTLDDFGVKLKKPKRGRAVKAPISVVLVVLEATEAADWRDEPPSSDASAA